MKPFRKLSRVILTLSCLFCLAPESRAEKVLPKNAKPPAVSQTPAPISTPQASVRKRVIRREYASETRLKLVTNWFLIGGGVVNDSDGGSAGTTQVSWTPALIFSDSVRFKINLGVSGINLFTSETFLGFDGAGSFVFSGARPLLFEVGGGAQYWSNKEGFLPQVRGGIGYRFSGQGNLFHAIQVTYSRLFNDLLRINMVVASLALRF